MQLEIGLLKKFDRKNIFSLIWGVATQNLSNFSPKPHACEWKNFPRRHGVGRGKNGSDVPSLKVTSHSTIFDIPMRPLREVQRHRRRSTR